MYKLIEITPTHFFASFKHILFEYYNPSQREFTFLKSTVCYNHLNFVFHYILSYLGTAGHFILGQNYYSLFPLKK